MLFNGDFDLICSECKFVMLLHTQKLPGDYYNHVNVPVLK